MLNFEQVGLNGSDSLFLTFGRGSQFSALKAKAFLCLTMKPADIAGSEFLPRNAAAESKPAPSPLPC
jgi:hypothetical protein